MSENSQQVERAQELVGFISNGGVVKRFHTITTLSENTVGQHSHGVALYCWALEGAASISSALLMAALLHDMSEQRYGDIPGNVKSIVESAELRRAEEEFVETVSGQYGDYTAGLDRREQKILRFADLLDGLTFCNREYSLGNKLIVTCLKNYEAMISQEIVTCEYLNLVETVLTLKHAIQTVKF